MRTAITPVTEEMRTSLMERISAMHQLWGLATKDLTLEHVNHFERSGVLPIAFSLTHFVGTEDRILSAVLGGAVLWDDHVAGLRLTGELPRYGTPMEVAERVRIGDLNAWRTYQDAVFRRTERMIANTSVARLSEHQEIPPPGTFAGTLKLLVGAPEFVRKIDRLEVSIYSHGTRHLGEVELARALVGLRGV